MQNTDLVQHRQAAIDWAKSILDLDDFLVLDTETTGTSKYDELVSLALINSRGRTVMNTLLKPHRSIPREATAIHGITDADVACAPSFPDVFPQLADAMNGRVVIGYNLEFDASIIRTLRINHRLPDLTPIKTHCAMQWYGRFSGEWDEYHGHFKWHKLTAACARFGISTSSAHSALGDCLMTLKLVQHMARS